ncbi:MAG: class I SAM-dependent methyltransferase [Parafilimonas sp.]
MAGAARAGRSRGAIDLARGVLEPLPRTRRRRILDLGAGSGSNLRYLTDVQAPTLQGPAADWLLVDHDPSLLSRVPTADGVETRCLDLSTLDDATIFDGRDLVTASALLDLVSEPWLRSLAGRCAEHGAAVLFALNYDGRSACSPEDSDDGAVLALVNEHQRTDKGFGPALGPDATDFAARCFAELGYQVRRAPSDWVLMPASADLQRQLIDGWTQAAGEMAPQQLRMIDAWRERRLAHVAAGWSAITVGHQDIGGSIKSEDLRI